MPRCFLGFPLSPEATKALIAVQEDLLAKIPRDGPQKAAKSIRPVSPDNFHLTLSFLGTLSDAQIAALKDMLRPAAQRAWSVGKVAMAGLGAFPNTRRPRAIFAEVVEGADRIIHLGEETDGICQRLGLEKDKLRRHPHITVCRVTDARPGGPLTPWIDDYPVSPLGLVNTEALVLYRSETKPTGSVYTPLYRWALSPAESQGASENP